MDFHDLGTRPFFGEQKTIFVCDYVHAEKNHFIKRPPVYKRNIMYAGDASHPAGAAADGWRSSVRQSWSMSKRRNVRASLRSVLLCSPSFSGTNSPEECVPPNQNHVGLFTPPSIPHLASLNTRKTRKVLSADIPPVELSRDDPPVRKLGGDRMSSTRLLITITPSNRLNLSTA